MNGPNVKMKPAASPQPDTTNWGAGAPPPRAAMPARPTPGALPEPPVEEPAVAPVENRADWSPNQVIDDILTTPPAPTRAPAPAPAPAPRVAQPAAEPPPPRQRADSSAVPFDVLGEAAEEPAEEPSAPAASAEHEADPEFREPKQKNAWAKIKAEKKELQQQVKDLQTRLESNKPPEMQALLEMKKQVEAYEERLGQLDITQTRAFQSRFEGPMKDIERKGIALLTRTGKDPSDAEALVSRLLSPGTTPDKLNEMLYDLPHVVSGALFNLVVEHEQIRKTREDAVKNWRDTKAALSQQEARDREIQLAQDVESETVQAVERAVAAGNWLFKPSSGADENAKMWNQGVSERMHAVRGILRTAKPVELAELVVEGLTAKTTRELFMAERARANALLAQLQKIENRMPRLGGGGGGGRAPAPARGAPRSAEQYIAETFA